MGVRCMLSRHSHASKVCETVLDLGTLIKLCLQYLYLGYGWKSEGMFTFQCPGVSLTKDCVVIHMC